MKKKELEKNEASNESKSTNLKEYEEKYESTVDKKVAELMRAVKARACETVKSVSQENTFY